MQEVIDIIYERVMQNFAGTIVMWSGTIATIPDGWQFCNGTNGTPDLRDKFVVSAKQDSGGVAKSNVTGVLQQTGGTVQHNHYINSGTRIGYGTNYGETTELDKHIPPFFALAYIMKL